MRNSPVHNRAKPFHPLDWVQIALHHNPRKYSSVLMIESWGDFKGRGTKSRLYLVVENSHNTTTCGAVQCWNRYVWQCCRPLGFSMENVQCNYTTVVSNQKHALRLWKLWLAEFWVLVIHMGVPASRWLALGVGVVGNITESLTTTKPRS